MVWLIVLILHRATWRRRALVGLPWPLGDPPAEPACAGWRLKPRKRKRCGPRMQVGWKSHASTQQLLSRLGRVRLRHDAPGFRNRCTHTRCPALRPINYDGLLNSTSPGSPSVPSSPKARQAIKANQGESSPIKAKRAARDIQTTCSKCATIAVDLKR